MQSTIRRKLKKKFSEEFIPQELWCRAYRENTYIEYFSDPDKVNKFYEENMADIYYLLSVIGKEREKKIGTNYESIIKNFSSSFIIDRTAYRRLLTLYIFEYILEEFYEES